MAGPPGLKRTSEAISGSESEEPPTKLSRRTGHASSRGRKRKKEFKRRQAVVEPKVENRDRVAPPSPQNQGGETAGDAVSTITADKLKAIESVVEEGK